MTVLQRGGLRGHLQRDCLGLVAVEAQAAGLPCLLFDRITREVAREVDVTDACRFLPVNDSAIWADALCKVRIGERTSVQKDCYVRTSS